mgnify:CR=1 FL=1
MSTATDTVTPATPLVRLSSLRADSALERNGDWVDAMSIPGVSFMVRSINFPKYTIQRDLLLQRLRRQSGGKPIAQDTLYTELGRLYAEHILLDWKGFDVPYSREVAMQTLTDPEYREVVMAVETAAGQVGQSTLEFVDEQSKNSAVPSATG